MKRLKEVYAAGGPSNFDFSVGKIEKPKVVAQVAEKVEDVVSEDAENKIEEIEDNDDLKEVTE
jgi:hypothetical protein